MAIKNGAILVDGTVSSTGGTSTTFSEAGGGPDTLNVILNNGAALQSRTTMTFSVKEPRPSNGAPGGFTQARPTIKVLRPKTLANGNRTVNTMTLSLAVDPETTEAEVQSLLVIGAQLFHDSDFQDFWKKLALG